MPETMEELRAELERVRAERDEAVRDWDEASRSWSKAESSLRAEREAHGRLREAALAYRDMIDCHYGDDFLPAERRGPRMALDDALAALPATEKEPAR